MFVLIQDKSRLVNVDDILVQDNKIVGVKANECQIELGSYENNDRAVDVLVKISNSIRNNYQTDVLIGSKRNTGKIVFVMPAN